MKAYNDYILIEPLPMKEVVVGGLVLSAEESKSIKSREAKILSLGPNCSDKLKVGDIIVHEAKAAHGVFVDGDMFQVLKEQNIILVKE